MIEGTSDLKVDSSRQFIRESPEAHDHSCAPVEHGTYHTEKRQAGRTAGHGESRAGYGRWAVGGRRERTNEQPVFLQLTCEIEVTRVQKVRRVVVAAAQPELREFSS